MNTPPNHVPPPPPGAGRGEPYSPSQSPTDTSAPALAESATVRSVYLYAVLGGSWVLMVAGVVLAVTSAFHIAMPSSAHRDTLDRVSVGLSNIVTEATLDLLDPNPSLEEFCRFESDLEACADEYESFIAIFGQDSPAEIIRDVASTIEGEVNSQIRASGMGRLVGGVALAGFGGLVFRRHRHLAVLYR